MQLLVTGLAIGFICRMLGLEVPAPNTLSGILGIVGLYLGYLICKTYVR